MLQNDDLIVQISTFLILSKLIYLLSFSSFYLLKITYFISLGGLCYMYRYHSCFLCMFVYHQGMMQIFTFILDMALLILYLLYDI